MIYQKGIGKKDLQENKKQTNEINIKMSQFSNIYSWIILVI